DSPAWSYRRPPYEPPRGLRRRPATTPYAELHCHSNFSFLDGASHPEQLAEEAARLGLEALALTDHDGLYGVVRFAEAAKAVGLKTVFGAEVTLRRGAAHAEQAALVEDDTTGQARPDPRWAMPAGQPDPHGEHLVLLAEKQPGYAALSRALSAGHLAGEKG